MCDPTLDHNLARLHKNTAPWIVGHYKIGGDKGLWIGLAQKPLFIHRFFMKHCLGWVWVDV